MGDLAPRPRVAAPASAAARGLFAGLSRLRRKRVAHPQGAGFEAELSLDHPLAGNSDASVLARPGPFGGLVRISRATGVPAPLPDILGIALRLTDAYGPSRDQDLLFVTAGTAPLARHSLIPAPRGFSGHFFSTLLPFLTGEGVRMLGLEPEPRLRSPHRLAPAAVEAPGRSYGLLAAPVLGAWRRLGTLRLGARIEDARTEAICFDPWSTGRELRPVGPLMRLRDPSYAGSQQGRGAISPNERTGGS